MNRRRVFLFLLCVVFPVFPACNQAGDPSVSDKPMRILWVGSSSTYYHDMPDQLARWITETTGRPTQSEMAGKGGTAIHLYLEPGFKADYGLEAGQTVLEKIQTGHYDRVVLQIWIERLGGGQDTNTQAFTAGIETYIKAIRYTEAEPILYQMAWGEGPEYDEGNRMFRKLAAEYKVRTALCGDAWKRVWQERPDLLLYDSRDRWHPGNLGTYLNMCCLYTALTGKSSVGLPYRDIQFWPFSDPEGSDQLRNSDDPRTFTLDPSLANYFQKTARDVSRNGP